MANGLLDILGSALGTTPPSYMEGLLGAQQTEDLRKRSIGSGLVNALVGYAAMPKNQNLGLGRILAGAAQAGMQGAQNVYSTAIQDYQTKAKIDEMNRQRAIQERDLRRQQEMEALAPQLIKTVPAQYEEVQGQPYSIPKPAAEGAVAPEFGLQQVMPDPTRRLVTPEQRTIDMAVMQRMAGLSKDPLATLKTSAELVPALRKAGMLQTGQQDNPFDMFAIGGQSPTVQNIAKQLQQSYQNGTLDQETAEKRIIDLGKMDETYANRIKDDAAREASLAQTKAYQEASLNIARSNATNAQAARDIANANKAQKVLPAGALKLESENITAGYEAANLSSQVDSQIKSIISSKLELSPVKNAQLATKSAFGSTDPEVLAYNDFNQFKTKLVNDTLRLNKGTQTEGDAVRAANELTNARSTQDAIRSLQKIRDINAKAVAMQNQIVASRRRAGGLTEDRGYTAPEQVPVPQFMPVIFTDKSAEYKKLPVGSTYINGVTGQTMTKTKD
jgi:cytochrome c556